MRSCFDWAFEEVMFSAAVWSLNQDPLRPHVICITRLAHTLDGVRIPGSRWGIDNPDTVYRVIPISGSERYVIRGRVAERRLAENYFTLWDEKHEHHRRPLGPRPRTDADRLFAITVDSEPTDDRPNHIRSAPEALELYIRDVLLDWARDEPNELTIERLGGAPVDAAAHRDEQAELTVRYMHKFADFTAEDRARDDEGRPTSSRLAYSADKGGALRNQVYIGGNFKLGDDEALVIDVSDGGAGYFVVPISNIWGTTIDIVIARAASTRRSPCPTPTAPTPTCCRARPGRPQLDRSLRPRRGHPDAAHGRVPRRPAERRPRREEPGRARSRASRGAAGRARSG